MHVCVEASRSVGSNSRVRGLGFNPNIYVSVNPNRPVSAILAGHQAAQHVLQPRAPAAAEAREGGGRSLCVQFGAVEGRAARAVRYIYIYIYIYIM